MRYKKCPPPTSWGKAATMLNNEALPAQKINYKKAGFIQGDCILLKNCIYKKQSTLHQNFKITPASTFNPYTG